MNMIYSLNYSFFLNYLQYLVERKATKCADYFEDISAFNTLKAFVPFC